MYKYFGGRQAIQSRMIAEQKKRENRVEKSTEKRGEGAPNTAMDASHEGNAEPEHHLEEESVAEGCHCLVQARLGGATGEPREPVCDRSQSAPVG